VREKAGVHEPMERLGPRGLNRLSRENRLKREEKKGVEKVPFLDKRYLRPASWTKRSSPHRQGTRLDGRKKGGKRRTAAKRKEKGPSVLKKKAKTGRVA